MNNIGFQDTERLISTSAIREDSENVTVSVGMFCFRLER